MLVHQGALFAQTTEWMPPPFPPNPLPPPPGLWGMALMLSPLITAVRGHHSKNKYSAIILITYPILQNKKLRFREVK